MQVIAPEFTEDHHEKRMETVLRFCFQDVKGNDPAAVLKHAISPRHISHVLALIKKLNHLQTGRKMRKMKTACDSTLG